MLSHTAGITIPGSQPLMIWGAEKKSENELIFFPPEGLFELFFIRESFLKKIFHRKAFEIYFFLEEGLQNFFLISSAPRSLIVVPLSPFELVKLEFQSFHWLSTDVCALVRLRLRSGAYHFLKVV